MECSAGRVCAPAHLDGFRDERGQEAEAPARHRGGAGPRDPSASDASDGAHQDEGADAERRLQALLVDAGAGRSVDRALGVRERAALLRRKLLSGLLEQPDAAAALCTPDEVRFAERSCAAQVLAGQL